MLVGITQYQPLPPASMLELQPDIVQTEPRARRGRSASFAANHSPLDATDFAVFGAILVFGVLEIAFVAHASDFLHDDPAFYVDAARSLIQHHFYGIEGRPETNMPPGTSAIVALLCLAGACSYTAIMRTMAVLQTFGFLASYALLRRVAPRAVAAVICLLLASSPAYFAIATQSLFSYFPYFFTSACALLAAQQLEESESPSRRRAWAALLAILCSASILVNSAGIALSAALLVRGLWLYLRRDRAGVARVRLLLAVALVGLATQGLWMQRHPAPFEWPLPGYPRPYLQQLRVRSGNDPELGMATPRDVVARVVRNADDHAAFLSELVVHHWMDRDWASPAVGAVLLLIILGWAASIRRTGGETHDWYFAAYEGIYLLWPWALESRFFLPVAPLACLYLWRGGQTAVMMAKRRPRCLAVAWLFVSAVLLLGAWSWMQGSAREASHVGIQSRVSLLLWVLSAGCATWWLWKSVDLSGTRASVGERTRRTSATRAPRVIGSALIAGLVLVGLLGQASVARANLDPHSGVNAPSPDVDAGIWLRSHTDTDAVVMARHVPTVYHVSARRVVWFPPSSDPRLLMDGIRRLGVDYIVVVHRDQDYYMPPEDSGFTRLLASYPGAFRAAFQSPRFSIYRTQRIPTAADEHADGAGAVTE